jgi:hypothetical protein
VVDECDFERLCGFVIVIVTVIVIGMVFVFVQTLDPNPRCLHRAFDRVHD